MVVVPDFSQRRMLGRLDGTKSRRCAHACPCYPPWLLFCAGAASRTASRSGPTAVGANHQVGCARRRPHAPLTSAWSRAHRSDARSLGRSRSGELFALIALGHAHLLQRFEGDAAGARAALDVCMLPLATAIRSAMDGSSAACLWSCVHACIVMHLTCHTFWWPCRCVI